MVKGISRRVILVEQPNSGVFEQAIFLLPQNDDGISQQQLVDEAVRIARSYANIRKPSRFRAAKPVLWATVGGGVMGALWLLVSLL